METGLPIALSIAVLISSVSYIRRWFTVGLRSARQGAQELHGRLRWPAKAPMLSYHIGKGCQGDKRVGGGIIPLSYRSCPRPVQVDDDELLV